ncbi:MAG: hypothetical protein QGH34_03100 [Candidatus Woesearchaeota archaeon]|jgi:hypothetical protein|nr:hypothetical protein [Candidatus Woesearchaeota archaeon]|tara:strand:- start:1905 stop:2102 length:198 start_codon:yes stop_codon:yes gene_type:complete
MLSIFPPSLFTKSLPLDDAISLKKAYCTANVILPTKNPKRKNKKYFTYNNSFKITSQNQVINDVK